MRVLVTGGAGYVGSMLVPFLLGDGHEVTVYDTLWFGDGFLPKDNGNLTIVRGDIRDIEKFEAAVQYHDAVIHLACISNDTSCQLDEGLSTSINYDAFEPLVITSKKSGVRRFIYCSSSSVYGISEAERVTEEHPLVPLTLYNKYKGLCEPILRRHQSKDFICTILRPATVCGYAPRMRFDLTVNIMTNHAVQKGLITVFGGEQKRPNLHIRDMCRAYLAVLQASEDVVWGETFNVGYKNMKVKDIAKLVAEVVEKTMDKPVAIAATQSTDNRSYHIDSERIRKLIGFEPQFTVEDAISEMCAHFKLGDWKDSLTNKWYTNIVQYQAEGVV